MSHAKGSEKYCTTLGMYIEILKERPDKIPIDQVTTLLEKSSEAIHRLSVMLDAEIEENKNHEKQFMLLLKDVH